MNQGGKHAAAEPGRLENKRERRRGAAGRASVLRRAPSDSDCSGETASLSADSGDRALRPAPLAPPRTGKTRNRRRGSEWEVLEGLKDGQRFEKRPDVFNGYLHKKRKWPLKGWHKRFFVVDGGILVYARSPTDVARGRLHGSVDVGLSVISAKARRRRIDIDADEFIYHLRAKTPDIFRTWLNVLKAHRLYRQHLLTFGARESAPKVQQSLDQELSTAETPSHTSLASEKSTESSLIQSSPDLSSSPIFATPLDFESSVYSHADRSSIMKWQCDTVSKDSLAPLKLENLEPKTFDLKLDDNLYHIHRSMCSMNCVTRCIDALKKKKSPNISLNSTDAEKQMTCTNLNSLKYLEKKLDVSVTDKSLHRYRTNVSNVQNLSVTTISIHSKENINLTSQNMLRERKLSPFLNNNKKTATTACFFFTRKKRDEDGNTKSAMKKSKKCTNLVKYKNLADEPTLKKQSSSCMLLGKYNLATSKLIEADRKSKAVACSVDVVRKENNQVQVMANKENKASQNVTGTPSDYDKITEKLMISMFRWCSGDREQDVKYHIDQVVQDLYDIKVDQETHPVKALFKTLLEYWLKNTSVARFRKAMTSEKSVESQSNKRLTKDVNLSSFIINKKTKETQFHFSDLIVQYRPDKFAATTKQIGKSINSEPKVPPKCQSASMETSLEKEKRIQELERLLRSTVYVCEMGRNNINKSNKEKDIQITKELIDNLGKSKNNDLINSCYGKTVEKCSSLAELPEIQDTINHLISETAIPADVAKEFLGAYLDVLMQDNSKSTTTSQSSDYDKQSQEISQCEVVAEAVIKRVSKSMTTLNILNDTRKDNVPMQNAITDREKQIDPGQVYLKDILDKVTTIFSKVNKIEDNNNMWHQSKSKEDPATLITKSQKTVKDELGRHVFKSKNELIYENCDQNSLVIDLSKYNLEQISMVDDPITKDMTSITIRLKEKPPNHGESKQTHLSLKFPDDVKPIVTNVDKSKNWFSFLSPRDSTSNDAFHKTPMDNKNVTCLSFETNRQTMDPKPYFSSSNATSKADRPKDESYNSLDEPTPTNTEDAVVDNRETDDLHSCYVMSIKKGALASKFQNKKCIKTKRSDSDSKIVKSREHSPSRSRATDKSDELSLFEKRAPKIIDEKFILLLLENLAYVSRTVPTLHKDINSLYVKLKKKHDKMIKHSSNTQGLSLLGKIYSEETSSNDRGTQIGSSNHQYTYINREEKKHASTNTNIAKLEEKCACTYLTKKFVDSGVQTDVLDHLDLDTPSYSYKKPYIFEPKTCVSNRDFKTYTQIGTNTSGRTNQCTSTPIWVKPTIETAANTDISYFPKNPSYRNLTLMPMTPRLERECLRPKRNLPRVRRELLKEIGCLPPSERKSTQSQTDDQFIRIEKRDIDYHVYQLFISKKCGVKASSSLTFLSNTDVIKDDIRTLYRCSSDPSNCSGLISPTIRGPQAGFVSGTPGGRLAGWIIESGGPLESASRELGQAQLSVQQLQRLLDALELQQQVHHDTDVSLDGASPSVKKDRRKFGLRKKKSNSKCSSVDLAPPHMDPSTSHTALSSLSALTAPPSPGGGASSMPNSAASLPIACAAARPQSLPGAESLNTALGPASLTSLTPDLQLREDFTVLAKDLVANLKGVISSLVRERGRVRAALEAAEAAAAGGAVLAALRTNLSSALHQNSELRTRLTRIHDASDIAEIMSGNSDNVRQFQPSLSYSSSCVSASEFFDAEEHEEDDLKQEDVIAGDEAGVIELDGDSSSEAGSMSSEDGSASSDNSEGAMTTAERVPATPAARWSRRTRLPAPRPSPGGPSLWNLLYKNIGKDLSQISMPVTINEPLNMLQRLCEELEYSELLDAAAACACAAERAALVAAFAVSAYAAAAHRAASKPFNPLLGESYECLRPDRGFRFLAEQVSHHPPISACHAESPRWCFWQEARIKTKFWGKSMEFQPTGRVHVRLNTTGDHYTWNKVTTCVHNLFGGQRWVDQYGDMHIVCVGTDISCKLNFVKASSWSQSRHEVRGAVTDGSTGTRLRLAGRWSEALYAGEPPAARCLWRPGAMPPEHELYYGFTRFAMELNEIEPGMRELLPRTDTRFRPDQRALEEGDVESAEAFKHQLEQAQRERRRESPVHQPAWFRKTVEEGEETWVFSGEYWKAREAGFGDGVPRIW